MFNIGFKEEIVDGVMVVSVNESVSALNPAIYRAVVNAGCALASKVDSPVGHEDLTVLDQQVFILSSLRDRITDDELKAILAHEIYHILSGDLEKINSPSKKAKHDYFDMEHRADLAAVAKSSAQSLKNALLAAKRLQVEKTIGRSSGFIFNMVMKFSDTRIFKKRLAALDSLIAQGK